MKVFKEIKEQYEYLWWWLLNQGLFLSTLIVNSFLFLVWASVMTVFYFVIRWYSRH